MTATESYTELVREQEREFTRQRMVEFQAFMRMMDIKAKESVKPKEWDE